MRRAHANDKDAYRQRKSQDITAQGLVDTKRGTKLPAIRHKKPVESIKSADDMQSMSKPAHHHHHHHIREEELLGKWKDQRFPQKNADKSSKLRLVCSHTAINLFAKIKYCPAFAFNLGRPAHTWQSHHSDEKYLFPSEIYRAKMWVEAEIKSLPISSPLRPPHLNCQQLQRAVIKSS